MRRSTSTMMIALAGRVSLISLVLLSVGAAAFSVVVTTPMQHRRGLVHPSPTLPSSFATSPVQDRRPPTPTTTTQLQASPLLDLTADSASGALSSVLLATIDSDIAKLSDNEFAPIFLGGILVMLGGLLSALFVGTVVDNKDLYASLVADSYLQDQDEAFWKGLSDEEKKKTQEMLERVRANKSGAGVGESTVVSAAPRSSDSASAASAPAPAPAATVAAPSKAEEPKVEVGMFSDYGDDV